MTTPRLATGGPVKPQLVTLGRDEPETVYPRSSIAEYLANLDTPGASQGQAATQHTDPNPHQHPTSTTEDGTGA